MTKYEFLLLLFPSIVGVILVDSQYICNNTMDSVLITRDTTCTATRVLYVLDSDRVLIHPLESSAYSIHDQWITKINLQEQE